jgi:hypothetical protein
MYFSIAWGLNPRLLNMKIVNNKTSLPLFRCINNTLGFEMHFSIAWGLNPRLLNMKIVNHYNLFLPGV